MSCKGFFEFIEERLVFNEDAAYGLAAVFINLLTFFDFIQTTSK